MPRPAAPAGSLPAPVNSQRPAIRLAGSVAYDKRSILGSTLKAAAPERFIDDAPVETSYRRLDSRHRVFRSLQRQKLLMGCELELAKLFITATVLCFMLAIVRLSLGWLLLSLLFGGPIMWVCRMFNQEDEDYLKVYLEALRCPHMREPE